jgi:hypothetical protein
VTTAIEPPVGALEGLRRRIDGNYRIDEFGGDPQLQDLVAPLVHGIVRARVEGADQLPRVGAAVLVANRGLSLMEPTVLSVALRQETGRRLRIVGAPDGPVFGDVLRRLGCVNSYPGDLGALLRAGHVAAIALGTTWLRGAGQPPLPFLRAALGFDVIPVAVLPDGPFGIPLQGWRVVVGEPLQALSGHGHGDPLAAAELAEAVRDAVEALLEAAR